MEGNRVEKNTWMPQNWRAPFPEPLPRTPLYYWDQVHIITGPDLDYWDQVHIITGPDLDYWDQVHICLLYTSPSPRDQRGSRMPSSA